MTYNVFGGTLNLAQSINIVLLLQFTWITGKQQYWGYIQFKDVFGRKNNVVFVGHLMLLCPKLNSIFGNWHKHTGMPTCKSGPGYLILE